MNSKKLLQQTFGLMFAVLLLTGCGGVAIGPTATPSPIPPTPTPMPPPLRQLAFTSERDGNTEIYLMNEDGSKQVNLTNNPASDWGPVWSPDGSKIVFVSDRDGNPEVYVMNADGSGQTNLSKSPANESEPAWSPDGKYIAFTSEQNNKSEIFLVNADGSGLVKLSNTAAQDSSPAWSPDGKKIAFISGDSQNNDLYVMNADGTGRVNLTKTSDVNEQNPFWSPNGSQIAYGAKKTGKGPVPGGNEIYVINSDGTGLTQFTKLEYAMIPRWSPDGKTIAFDLYVLRGWTRGNNNTIIVDATAIPFVMNADGSEIKALIKSDNPKDMNYGSAWSSNAKQFAFMSNRDGNEEIYIMNVDGSNQVRLTNSTGNDKNPVWRPKK